MIDNTKFIISETQATKSNKYPNLSLQECQLQELFLKLSNC